MAGPSDDFDVGHFNSIINRVIFFVGAQNGYFYLFFFLGGGVFLMHISFPLISESAFKSLFGECLLGWGLSWAVTIKSM